MIRLCLEHAKESFLSQEDGKKLVMAMEKCISSTTVRERHRGWTLATGRLIGLARWPLFSRSRIVVVVFVVVESGIRRGGGGSMQYKGELLTAAA